MFKGKTLGRVGFLVLLSLALGLPGPSDEPQTHRIPMLTIAQLDAELDSISSNKETYASELDSLIHRLGDDPIEVVEVNGVSTDHLLVGEKYMRAVAGEYPRYRNVEVIRAVRRYEFSKRRFELSGLDLHESDVVGIRNEVAGRSLPLILRALGKFSKDDTFREDLIQECYFGIHSALEKFEWQRGLAWGTYVFHWIRERAMHAKYRNRLIAIPASSQKLISTAMKINTGGLPETAAIALISEKMGASGSSVEAYRKVNATRLTSVDMVISDDGETTYADVIEDPAWETVYRPTMGDVTLRDLIKSAMKVLSAREVDVVSRIYGIGCDPESQYEVSREMGVSHQRVAQIRNRALRKMQDATSFSLAEPYLQ